ncbi:conserved hypothetical protein [Neospora caninum Liverpool]|nr:conserved hypothetical protein [Neospora caninum Liverpool]CBZ54867.1 conserved hypothetical protein [Neospora caninum Liverpool]|eukprot:XP_003884895.1 conserved hypothetical protein [Neospora caninum Liverpool]
MSTLSSSSSPSAPSQLTAAEPDPVEPPSTNACFDDGASDIAVLRQYIDLFEKTSSFALDPDFEASAPQPGVCRLNPTDRPASGALPSRDARRSVSAGEETGAPEGGDGVPCGAPGDTEAEPGDSEVHRLLGFRLRSTLQLLLLLRQTEILGMRLHRILREQRERKERLGRRRKTSYAEAHRKEAADDGEEEAFAVSEAVDAWALTSEMSEGQALRWIFARYRSVQVLVALEAWLQWEARDQAGRPFSSSPLFSVDRRFSGAGLAGFRDSAERHTQSMRVSVEKDASSASSSIGAPPASAPFYHADWPYVLPGSSCAAGEPQGKSGEAPRLSSSPSPAGPLVSALDRRETRAFFAGLWRLLRMGLLLEAEKQAVERGAAWLIEVIRGDEPWMEPYVSDDVDLSLQVSDVFSDQEIRLLSDTSPILKACLWPSGYSLQHVALAARAEGEESRAPHASPKRADSEKAERDLRSTSAWQNAGIAAALEKKQTGWYGEGKKGRSLLVHVCQRILAKQHDSTESLSVSSSASAPVSGASPCAPVDFAAVAGKGALGILGGLGVGETVETHRGGYGMEKFEQAIYGYLSGSLEAMEHVCTGWGDCLFALVRAVKASLIEGTLRCMRSHEPHGRFAGEPRRGGFLPPLPRRKHGAGGHAASGTGDVDGVPSTSSSARTDEDRDSVSTSPRKKRRTLEQHGSPPEFSHSLCGESPQPSPRYDLPDGHFSVGVEKDRREEGEGTKRKRTSLHDPLRILLTDFLHPQSPACGEEANTAQQVDGLRTREGGPETVDEESGEKVCCCGRAWAPEDEGEAREGARALLGYEELAAAGGDTRECREAEGARNTDEGGRSETVDEPSFFSGEERCAKQVDEGVLALFFNIMNDLPLFLRRFVPSPHSRKRIETEGVDELRLLQLFLIFHFLQKSSSLAAPPRGLPEDDEKAERSLYAKSIKKILRKTFRYGPRLVLPRRERGQGEEAPSDLVTVCCSPSLPFQEFTAFLVVLQGDLQRPFLSFPSSLASPASLPVPRSPLPLSPRGLGECPSEDAHDGEGLSLKDADFLVGGFVAQLLQRLPVVDVLSHAKTVEFLRYVSAERRVKLLSDWLWRRFAARLWESREGRELLEACVCWIASNFPQDVLHVALRCAERGWRCARPFMVGRGASAKRGEGDAASDGEDELREATVSDGHEDEDDSQEERLIFDETHEETPVERLQFSVFLILSVFSLYYLNRKFESRVDQPLVRLLKNTAATSSLLPRSSAASSTTRWLLLLGLYCLGVIAHLGLLGLCLDLRGLVRLARGLLRRADAGDAPVEPNAPEEAAPRGPSRSGRDGETPVSPSQERTARRLFRDAGEADEPSSEKNSEEKAETEKRRKRESRPVSGLGDWIRFAVDPGLVSPVLDLLLQELDAPEVSAGARASTRKRREDEEDRRPDAARDAERPPLPARRSESATLCLPAETERDGKAALESSEEPETGHDLRSRPSTVSFVSCDEPSHSPSSLRPPLDPIEKLRTALVGGAPVLRLRDGALVPTAHLVQFHDLLTASSLSGAVARALAPAAVSETQGPCVRQPSTVGDGEASSILSAAAALFRTSALFAQSETRSPGASCGAVSQSQVRSANSCSAPASARAASEEGREFFPLFADRRREEEAAALGALELESRLQLEQLSRRVATLLHRADEARVPSIAEKDRRVKQRQAMLTQLEKERRRLKTHASLASLFHVPCFVEEDLASDPDDDEGPGDVARRPGGAESGLEAGQRVREGRGRAALLVLLRAELLGLAQQLVVLWSRVAHRERETKAERGAREGREPRRAADRTKGNAGDEERRDCRSAAGVIVFASEVLATTASRFQKAETVLQQALALGDFPS